MNIFVLDNSPTIAAKYMCDKHVVKMILESCQLLSTAHRVLDGTQKQVITSKNRKYTTFVMSCPKLDSFLYKSTMINHPCTIWTRDGSSNYAWLAYHNISLINEYSSRYNKNHASTELAQWLLRNIPNNIIQKPLTPFALAMPDEYKCENAVWSYRNYYINEKYKFAKWKNGNVPNWYTEGLSTKNELVSA